ncbi:MAG: ClpX C4-type zinc finger protein [Phycisphaerales bacterium]
MVRKHWLRGPRRTVGTMHNPQAEGNEFFVCDFCHHHWAEDRPMVEGHKGALICSRCLEAGYAEVVYSQSGVQGTAGDVHPRAGAGPWCTMCLERRAELYWQSPITDTLCCRRCLKQSAGVLERDPDFGWKRPTAPAGVEVAPDGDDDDE